MAKINLKGEIALLARFGGAGVLTTIVGFLVILVLDVGLGVDRRIANAVSYAVGASLGFLLQRLFVFGRAARERGAGLRYALVLLTAFATNQMVLSVAGPALPQTSIGHIVAQLLAMGSYTGTQFALLRLWAFRPTSAGAEPATR